MSFDYYTKWWIASKAQLQRVRKSDGLMRKDRKLSKDRALASHLIGGVYAQYSMVVQDLVTCLDQLAQVQKKITIRKLVDAAATRLNELKDDLTKIDLSEFHYIDGALVELKLIPHDVEILNPSYNFPRPYELEELWKRLKMGERIYIPPDLPEDIESQSMPDAISVTTGGYHAPSTSTGQGDSVQQPEIAGMHSEETTAVTPEQKKKRIKPKTQFFFEVKQTPQEIAAIKEQERIKEAVQIIQNAERGRAMRLYFNDEVAAKKAKIAAQQATREQAISNRATVVKGITSRNSLRGERAGKSSSASVARSESEDSELLMMKADAATIIQSTYRGYLTRQKLKRDENKRRILIQMSEPSWKSHEEFDKLKINAEKRREYRDEKVREYIQTHLDERVRVLRVIAPGLFEDIGDEIREWFYQWYTGAKNFDKFPSVEKGGSILVVRGETFTPEEWIDEVERKRRDKVKLAKMGAAAKEKAKAAKIKQKKEEDARKKKEQKEKRKKEKEAALRREKGTFEFDFQEESPANQIMVDAHKEFVDMWQHRKFEDNPQDMPYMDLITNEKCYELQLEVRTEVDKLLRLELDLLNEALARDRVKLGKKGKKKGKKKKGGGNKAKGKKKKKAKKNKDPTGDRTTEDMFQELYDNGIIRTYPQVSLSDFRGDFSYNNWEKRNLLSDPPHTLGDVRQAVALNCIMALGPENMSRPKSVLIVGSTQTGKHLLANAIFNETRCVLFDLSAKVLAGKYPEKAGMKALLYLVNKMSRLLQPSIIFFDGAEKPFYKKVPKAEKSWEPKRIGTSLFKSIIKPITPADRILVLGISGAPFLGKPNKLKKCYQRVILIPKPDYGSVMIFWREMLMPYHGIDRNLDLTALATLTKDYPLVYLKGAVLSCLRARRLIQLKFEPLSLHELLNALFRGPQPITDKEWKKFIKFMKKMPLFKERVKMIEMMDKKRQMLETTDKKNR